MKIGDRFLLGAVSGTCANLTKVAVGKFCVYKGWSEITGPERAAGMLVPPHSIADPKGRLIGYMADSAIASLLGIASVYALSVTGSDKAVLKGAFAGQSMWTLLYGVMGTLGATKVAPVSPQTVMAELVGHTVFGATVALIATALGDPMLFTGGTPLSASQFASAGMAGQSSGTG